MLRTQCKFEHLCEASFGSHSKQECRKGNTAQLPIRGPHPSGNSGGKGGGELLLPVSRLQPPLNRPEAAEWSDSGLARTPVRVGVLDRLLHKYPNERVAAYLLEGFSSGFRIPFTVPQVSTDCANLKFAHDLLDVVVRKLSKKCEASSIASPFSSPPLSNLRLSPLKVVPKKAPGKYRLVHHLSYPKGGSVNDAITAELCNVCYTSLDHAVNIKRGCSPGALMAKCDVQSTFCLLPIHPEDFCLLDFKFGSKWYVDKAMPMGCSITCTAFETFSNFLEWVAKVQLGCLHMTHYLERFFLCWSSGHINLC